MKLYFFRHAIAEDGTPDHLRQLTQKGIDRTRAGAQMLAAVGVQPRRIYSSPLVRARQTAELLSAPLNAVVQVKDEVGPGFNMDAVRRLISDVPDDEDVMFVGHEPDFSLTVSALIGGGGIVMKKGGLARIDVLSRDPLRGELVWLIPPKVLATYRSGMSPFAQPSRPFPRPAPPPQDSDSD